MGSSDRGQLLGVQGFISLPDSAFAPEDRELPVFLSLPPTNSSVLIRLPGQEGLLTRGGLETIAACHNQQTNLDVPPTWLEEQQDIPATTSKPAHISPSPASALRQQTNSQ